MVEQSSFSLPQHHRVCTKQKGWINKFIGTSKKTFLCVSIETQIHGRKMLDTQKLKEKNLLSHFTFYASKSFICNMHVKFPYLDLFLPSPFGFLQEKSSKNVIFTVTTNCHIIATEIINLTFCRNPLKPFCGWFFHFTSSF